MITKEFKTTINASREAVWHVLWDNEMYPQWTRAFAEGSHAVSDWNEGSDIQFLGTDNCGMYSVIEKKEEPAYMSFRHLGEIKNGEKQEPIKEWQDARETYTLHDKGGQTELVVTMDTTEEYASYFADTWPKALEDLKKLSEAASLKTADR